ncbi:MAG: (E)-4-hydroxy-3-methylbut-2-enyl-diphosphate synthase [Treponema sp.]|nr:(E)-4-hydroxy-3-methylbut-2-enyl-diphosphate synthase [Treponema sp.]
MSGTTRVIKIGGFEHVEPVMIGGDHPVVIQTMWKDRLSFSDLEDKAAKVLIERIDALAAMGCGLLRFAVPDMEGAGILGRLSSMVSLPFTADIHFDYRIALRCLDFPIAKIRINPGNIGSTDKVRLVLEKAAARGVPIRIGVNAGSLPLDLRQLVDSGSLDPAAALVEAAERELAVFDQCGFTAVLVSMKASSAAQTMKANRLFASRHDVPLHIGVTEAGPLIAGVVRNTTALLPLLSEGTGDTIRISLSDTPENEVIAAKEILASAAEIAAEEGREGAASRLRQPAVTIISCPRCGRHSFDTHAFTERWMPRLYSMKKSLTLAIMGCAVNGPGEARHADLGITGAGDKVLIFRHGKVIRTIDAEDADTVFAEELNGG